MKRILASFLILASASTAEASDWYMFMPSGHSPNRRVYFVDRSSVQAAGGNKRAWFQVMNETPAEKGTTSMKQFIEVDCVKKRSRFLTIQAFSANSMIGSTSQHRPWTYIAPDSMIEALSETVCSNDYSDNIKATLPLEAMAQSAFEAMNDNGNSGPRP